MEKFIDTTNDIFSNVVYPIFDSLSPNNYFFKKAAKIMVNTGLPILALILDDFFATVFLVLVHVSVLFNFSFFLITSNLFLFRMISIIKSTIYWNQIKNFIMSICVSLILFDLIWLVYKWG